VSAANTEIPITKYIDQYSDIYLTMMQAAQLTIADPKTHNDIVSIAASSNGPTLPDTNTKTPQEITRIRSDAPAETSFAVSRVLVVPTTSPIATVHMDEVIKSSSPLLITADSAGLRPSTVMRKKLNANGNKENSTLNKAHLVNFAFMRLPRKLVKKVSGLKHNRTSPLQYGPCQ
jgi:hypothetical protein